MEIGNNMFAASLGQIQAPGQGDEIVMPDEQSAGLGNGLPSGSFGNFQAFPSADSASPAFPAIPSFGGIPASPFQPSGQIPASASKKISRPEDRAKTIIIAVVIGLISCVVGLAFWLERKFESFATQAKTASVTQESGDSKVS